MGSIKLYLQREIVKRVKHQNYNDFCFGIQADDVSDVYGEALSEQIIKTVSSLLRSKSYDGAGNMAGANKGCASRIKVCFQELNIITA